VLCSPQDACLKVSGLRRLYSVQQNQQRRDHKTEHNGQRCQKDLPAHFYATT
jgi:hypothetical protein